MKSFLSELGKQFLIGAINGFFVALLATLIFSSVTTVYYLYAFTFGILLTGIAKVIVYFIYRCPVNIFTEWQVVSLILVIFSYLYTLSLKINDYYSIPEYLRGDFIKLFDVTYALFALIYLSIFNLVFAFVLRVIKTKS